MSTQNNGKYTGIDSSEYQNILKSPGTMVSSPLRVKSDTGFAVNASEINWKGYNLDDNFTYTGDLISYIQSSYSYLLESLNDKIIESGTTWEDIENNVIEHNITIYSTSDSESIDNPSWQGISPKYVIDNCNYYNSLPPNWSESVDALDSHSYIYMSSAYKVIQLNGLTYSFHGPLGKATNIVGHNGQTGNFKSTVFVRTNIEPRRPATGAVYSTGLPTDTTVRNNELEPIAGLAWSDGIPSGQQKLWASTAIIRDESAASTVWSNPSQMTDTETYDVEFSLLDSDPGNPDDNPRDWYDPTTDYNNLPEGKTWEDMLWRAERTCYNGEWSHWIIVRIKGEKGSPGDYYEQRYRTAGASDSVTVPTNITVPGQNDSTWTLIPNYIQGQNTWMTSRRVHGYILGGVEHYEFANNSSWSTPIRMNGIDGIATSLVIESDNDFTTVSIDDEDQISVPVTSVAYFSMYHNTVAIPASYYNMTILDSNLSDAKIGYDTHDKYSYLKYAVGNTEYTLAKLSYYENLNNPSKSTYYLTTSLYEGFDMTSINRELRIRSQATIIDPSFDNSGLLSQGDNRIFTNKVTGLNISIDDIYQLQLDRSTVKRNANNELDTVTVNLKSLTSNNIINTPAELANKNLHVYCNNSVINDITVPVDLTQYGNDITDSSFKFELKYNDGNDNIIIDTEYVSVVRDGQPGNPGTDSKSQEFIYMLTDNIDFFNDSSLNNYYKPQNWNNTNVDDYPFKEFSPTTIGGISYVKSVNNISGNGIIDNINDLVIAYWTDNPQGISEKYPYEWWSTRSYDTTNEIWESFSKPVIRANWGHSGEDGDGVEYIYYRNNSETFDGNNNNKPFNWFNDIEYQSSEYIRSGTSWSDNPKGVTPSAKYEWVSTRKYNTTGWLDKIQSNVEISDINEILDGLDGTFSINVYDIHPTELLFNIYFVNNDGGEINGVNYTLSDLLLYDDWGEKIELSNYVQSTQGIDDLWNDLCTLKSQYTAIPHEVNGVVYFTLQPKVKYWGFYSTPKLWAKYGEQGQIGPAGASATIVDFSNDQINFAVDDTGKIKSAHQEKTSYLNIHNIGNLSVLNVSYNTNYFTQSEERINEGITILNGDLDKIKISYVLNHDEIEIYLNTGSWTETSGITPIGGEIKDGITDGKGGAATQYIYATDLIIPEGGIEADFTVTLSNNYSYTKTLNICGQHNGEDGENAITYEIIPSVNAIHYDGTNYNPSQISYTIVKYDGTNISNVTTGFSSSFRAGWTKSYQSKITYASSYNSFDNASYINLSLYRSSKLIDRETIPIICDGNNGRQGFTGAIVRNRGEFGKPILVNTIDPPSNKIYYLTGTFNSDYNGNYILYKDIVSYSFSVYNSSSQTWIKNTKFYTPNISSNNVKYFNTNEFIDTFGGYPGMGYIHCGNNDALAGAYPATPNQSNNATSYNVNTNYWKEATQFDFIATKLLYADQALINQISSHDFIATREDGYPVAGITTGHVDNSGNPNNIVSMLDPSNPDNPIPNSSSINQQENGKSVRIWAGEIEKNNTYSLTNAPFRVLEDGTTYMTKAFIEGDITADTLKLGANSFFNCLSEEGTKILPKLTPEKTQQFIILSNSYNYTIKGATLGSTTDTFEIAQYAAATRNANHTELHIVPHKLYQLISVGTQWNVTEITLRLPSNYQEHYDCASSVNIFGAANYLNANNEYALSYYISNQGLGFIPRGKELSTGTGGDPQLKDIEFSFFAYIQNNYYTSEGVNICLGEILCEQPASIPNN